MSSKLSVTYGTLNLTFLTNGKLYPYLLNLIYGTLQAKQSKAQQAKPHVVQR